MHAGPRAGALPSRGRRPGACLDHFVPFAHGSPLVAPGASPPSGPLRMALGRALWPALIEVRADAPNALVMLDGYRP